MDQLAQFVAILLYVYMLCVFVWALLSWLPMISPSLAYNDTITSMRRFLDSIVEPYVRQFRRFIPPMQMGGTMLDLSALVAILVLIVAQEVLPDVIASLG